MHWGFEFWPLLPLFWIGIVALFCWSALRWFGWRDRRGPSNAPFEPDALEIVLDSPEIHDEMVRRTPVKRLGVPEDIAYCALYLAAPAGSFVTGKLFEIDGGLEEANLEMGLPDL